MSKHLIPTNGKLTAKRITQENQQSKQLATFVASLGINSSLELYSCNDQVYINADVILPVLSVELAWFHKNAEIPIHYIILNKITYINRYGMTKLLGQSKQPAAFKLQDYLYELFYRVETEGIVVRDTVASRKQLLALTDQVDLYRDIIEKNQTDIYEAKEAASAALNDYASIEQENGRLQGQVETLEQQLKESMDEVDTYKSIANKLAKYVRIKSKTQPAEAFSDALDVDMSDDENDDEDENKDGTKNKNIHCLKNNSSLKNMDPSDTSLAKDTLAAKTKLRDISTKRPVIKSRAKSAIASSPEKNTHTLYIMRSVKPVDYENNYKWELVDIEPADALLTQSAEYLSGEIDYIQSLDLCYRQIYVTDERRYVMVLFMDVVNGIMDESTMEKLIS